MYACLAALGFQQKMNSCQSRSYLAALVYVSVTGMQLIKISIDEVRIRYSVDEKHCQSIGNLIRNLGGDVIIVLHDSEVQVVG